MTLFYAIVFVLGLFIFSAYYLNLPKEPLFPPHIPRLPKNRENEEKKEKIMD